MGVRCVRCARLCAVVRGVNAQESAWRGCSMCSVQYISARAARAACADRLTGRARIWHESDALLNAPFPPASFRQMTLAEAQQKAAALGYSEAVSSLWGDHDEEASDKWRQQKKSDFEAGGAIKEKHQTEAGTSHFGGGG